MSHRARDKEKQDEKYVIVGTQKCRRKEAEEDQSEINR